MPPSFPRQNQAVVLGDARHPSPDYAYGAVTLYGGAFQPTSASPAGGYRRAPRNPTFPRAFARRFGLGSPPFGRPYSGDPYWFLFLPLLRCFRSGGSHSVLPPLRAVSRALRVDPAAGSPIRESPDQRLRAPTRGLSQLATPFFGARAEPSTERLSCASLAGANPIRVAAELCAALTAVEDLLFDRSALHPGGLTSRAASSEQNELGAVPGELQLGKEVIRPQVPLRPPCYDFSPLAGARFDPTPFGAGPHPAPARVERRAVCARSRDVFTARW